MAFVHRLKIAFSISERLHDIGKANMDESTRINDIDVLVIGGGLAAAFAAIKGKGKWILATGSTWYKGLLPGHRDDTGDGFGMTFRAGVYIPQRSAGVFP